MLNIMLNIMLTIFVAVTLLLPSPVTPATVRLSKIENIFPLKFLQGEEIEVLFNESPFDNGLEPKRQPAVRYEERAAQTRPRAEVSDFGNATGSIFQTLKGRDFLAFQSIPYAQPPIGDLRFQMPVPWSGPWPQDLNGNYDATYLRARCPQSSMAVSYPGGREDCLYISIYTPPDAVDGGKSYPVMFFIHGGAFISGDASLYVPTKLLDQDVVVVVVQYRLGSLGFLAAQTPDNPGNMGLLDQVTALRWVKKYISNFGGDLNSITVFGQSAGGASSSWLLFTPTTTAGSNDGEQLFDGVIMQSGSALEVWGHDPDPEAGFILQADAVNCWDPLALDPKADALACMRALPVQEVVSGYLKVYLDDRLKGGLGFVGNSPVIQTALIDNFPNEVDANPDLVVIDDHPLNQLARGEFIDVPFMAGSTRDEGSLVLGLVYDDFLIKHGLQDNETFLSHVMLPGLVNSFGILDTTGAVSNTLRLNYLRDAAMGNFSSMSPGLVDMLGMLFLKTGLWTLTELATYKRPDTPKYFYSFEYESDDSLFNWMFFGQSDLPVEGGITHGDELLYMFYLPSFIDGEQFQALDRMTTLWTNFAKYSNPTPTGVSNWVNLGIEEWKPFTGDSLHFLLMSDNFTLEQDYPLQWNYHSLPSSPSNNVTKSIVQTSMIEQFKEESEAKDKEIQELENKTRGWKIAVGALGSCCLLLVSYILFILLRMRT